MEGHWFLEYIASDGTRTRHWIARLPFTVGRDADNDLHLDAPGLSRHHARFSADGSSGALRLTDLGSTNGSFINREPVHGPCRLADDDVVHLGISEFRFGRAERSQDAPVPTDVTMVAAKGRTLPEHFVRHEKQFMELLAGVGLSGAAQPIVDAQTGTLVAYELLGRSLHPQLRASPVELLMLAARLDREVELSAAWRDHGVRVLAPHLRGARLFVNTHPKETFGDDFVAGLARLREGDAAPGIVVEIHESAVVEIERMRELAARLKTIGVPFAYDDFGAGQSRLNEIAEVPPDYVKFDMGLVREIHRASERKQRLVREFVRVVRDMGSLPLAEGVEFDQDAVVCREMGFALLQGYFNNGQPIPLAQFQQAFAAPG